jgi:hypothetical protein
MTGELDQKVKLKMIGYWNDEFGSFPEFITPSVIRNMANYGPFREDVIFYLRSGKISRRCMGFAENRLPGIVPSERLGSQDLTDGEWIWPEGLDAYVEFAGIRLPAEFIESMKRNHFRVPDVQEAESSRYSMNSVFWEEWCSSIQEPDRQDPARESPR